jgi:hypothetical protein
LPQTCASLHQAPPAPSATAAPQSAEMPGAQTVLPSWTGFVWDGFSRGAAYTENAKG